MPSILFMRGVNVGGKRFSPKALVKALAHLDVDSIGAAGTFVVRAKVAAATLRDEFASRLPFESELIICPARDLLALPQPKPPAAGVRVFLTVLAKKPVAIPKLPLATPYGRDWQVRLIAIEGGGRFVLSEWRRTDSPRLLYPNEVVERKFKLPATTRAWDTIEKIKAALT